MKEITFAVDATVLTFFKVLAERVGDAALLQVIQNVGPVNLGTFDKYKPVIVLLAEFLRRTFLESTNAMTEDEIKKATAKIADILSTTKVAPDMPPPVS